MRWQQLFDDLEAQLRLLQEQELVAEVAEHTRAERGQVELAHRLLAALDDELRLRVRGVGWVPATVRDVGKDWIALESSGAVPGRGSDLLVPLAAVTAIEGLTQRSDPAPGAASRRLDLRNALRAVSRDRAVVRLHDQDGDHLTGTIQRVLADHLDLARHPDLDDRRKRTRALLTLPYSALALVRRI